MAGRVSTAAGARPAAGPVPAPGTAVTRVMLAKTSVRLISGEFLYCRFIYSANSALLLGDADTLLYVDAFDLDISYYIKLE